MTIQKVALGYWYQRTSLHLAEVHDFLIGQKSPLNLKVDKLNTFRRNLHIKDVTTDTDVLERLDVEFQNGIIGRIYEDGLVVLFKEHQEIKADIALLSSFFEDHFLPAIKYLFSLGAPVPKELAGVVTPTPLFIVVKQASKSDAVNLFNQFQDNYAEIEDKNIQVLKGGNFYLLNLLGDFNKDEHLIESLIFFKEFKAQLHHYLNLHRVLWEKIEEIKERKAIKGKDISSLRSELESYKKTVELISGRIDQMNLYIPTRAAVVANNNWQKFLTATLQFQYNNLDHTLEYIKSIWQMTINYLDSAIQVFAEAANLSTRNSVQALTIISSIGVISGVLGFLAADKLPQITQTGVVYFGVLLGGTLIINRILKYFYRHIKYKINDVKLAKISSDRKI